MTTQTRTVHMSYSPSRYYSEVAHHPMDSCPGWHILTGGEWIGQIHYHDNSLIAHDWDNRQWVAVVAFAEELDDVEFADYQLIEKTFFVTFRLKKDNTNEN